jgi:hypothetical protein
MLLLVRGYKVAHEQQHAHDHLQHDVNVSPQTSQKKNQSGVRLTCSATETTLLPVT